MRILILKPSSLGDVVQALPVARLLKRWRPEAEIWWWVEKDCAPLLEGDPGLAGVLRFDRRGWWRPRGWAQVWDAVQRMRQLHFDWVIDLQSLARSGAFAWLANGELLAGLDDAREGARGFYDVRVPRPGYYTHAVDWYVSVLRALGVPTNAPFVWLPPRFAAARSVAQRWQPEGKRWVAFAPGARWDNKRWPVEHFAALARQLTARHAALRIVLLGSAADAGMGRAIAAAAPERCLDVTGQTSLHETVEWLRHCRVLVTNDTGPMHLAAALRLPVAALFGPTEPARTGPYGSGHEVLQLQLACVPCMKSKCRHHPPVECLRALGPEMVAGRVLRLLDGPPPPVDDPWQLT